MPARRLVPVLLAILVGCEGSKPPTKARPIDDGPVAEALPPIATPKPEKSDPAAALAVNAILMAHTNNEPSLVEKLRKVQIRRKGEWKLPDGSRSEATMEIAIWGDQYRTTFAIAGDPCHPVWVGSGVPWCFANARKLRTKWAWFVRSSAGRDRTCS